MARNGKEILVYSIAKQEEVEEVANFAEETYFSSSPVREIYSSDGVTITKEERLAWTRNRYQNCIQHPTSILVTVREKSTGRLIAFQSLTMRIRGESSAAIWVDPNDRSTGWLLRAILAKLQGGADLYALYKTDRILHLGNASVRRDYQGQKLIGMRNATCRALFAKIAHDNRIGAMMVEGINHYAALLRRKNAGNSFILFILRLSNYRMERDLWLRSISAFIEQPDFWLVDLRRY